MPQPNDNGISTLDNFDKLTQSFNWADTPLGNPSQWPENLRRAVSEKLTGEGITARENTGDETILKLLEKEEQRSHLAIEAAQLGTFDWDLAKGIFIQSQRLVDIFGFTNHTKITHQDLINTFHPEDLLIRNKAVAESFEKGSLMYEARVLWADASVHWVRVYGKTVYDDEQKPSRMYGTVQDITKEKEIIKLLADSEDRLRLALDSAGLGTWDLHLNPTAIFYSPRLAQIFGYDEFKELNSREFRDRVHPEDLTIVVKAHQDALTSGIVNYEVRIIWKDKTIHWIRSNGKTLYNDKNEPVRMIGIVMDITEEKTAITALKESELLFKIISSASPVGIWLTDKEGSCVFVNETWIEWTGQPLEKNLGAGWLSKVPAEDIPATKDRFTDALINRKYFNAEFRLKKGNGDLCWCLTEGFPFYGIDGEFAGFAGSVTDITERKSIEKELERKVKERTEALKQSEERNNKMINEIQDYAILLLSKEGVIENWNKGAEKIKGYKEEEIVGKNFRIFYTEEDQEDKLPERLINTAIQEGRASTEGWRKRKDGSRFWASIVITALHDDKNNIIGFSKVTRDLTERKITEDQHDQHTKELSIKNYELQKQKEFVDTVLDSSVDIISVFDTDTRYISLNRKFEEMYNVKKEHVIGKKAGEVFSDEKISFFLENLKKAIQGENIHGIIHKSPITGRHYESFFVPLKNNNEVYAVLAVAHDNTDIIETAKKLEIANEVLEEKTKDLQRVNSALEKSNSELEQYAYVASHDLQEPLRKIRTYSGILNENLKKTADAASMATLQKVINSAARMSNLIYDLLNFSRLLNPEKHFVATDLNKTFEEIINDFELIIQQKQANIKVNRLPEIEAVPLQMNQLFYNLLNNALKFSKEDTSPIITINAKHLTIDEINSHTDLDSNLEHVDIMVADNGIGFSQQYAAQIFEVFKRLHTKQAYQGSGIGLALCRRIVLNHCGDIYAEGEENKGSVFHVILPVKQLVNKHDVTPESSSN